MYNETGNETKVSTHDLVEEVSKNLDKKDWNGCVGCADCCTMFAVTAPLAKQMEEFATAHFGQPTDKIQIKNHHICSKLDPKTRKCTIYDSRPEICRTFFCDASKTRAKTHKLITEEIQKNDNKTDPRTIDIYPYLSKIRKGQGLSGQGSGVESEKSNKKISKST